MKKFKLLLSFLCAAVMSVPMFFAACGDSTNNGDINNPGNQGTTGTPNETPLDEWVDYAGEVKLDFSSKTKKQEVEVRLFVDGDTTHFNPVKNPQYTDYNAADFAGTDGYIKARYLAINTPESTGKIEEYGKAASKFTHTKLENAKTIIVESDNERWNVDSTGERYLLWIWYLNEGETEFRNLNIEILQEGLAIASGVSNGIYGVAATAALNQAKAYKLKIHSGLPDEEFFYGEAIPVTLKELRCHLDDLVDKKVRVTGIVTAQFNNSIYVEEFDPDTGVCFGMAIYYGYGANSALLEVLSVGNEVSLVGYVQYYEGGDTFQISGLSYNKFNKDDPNNSNIISTDKSAMFVETKASDIVSGKLSVNFDHVTDEGEVEIETVQLDYGAATMSTSVTVSDLTVISAYTTATGNSAGAISLTCKAADGTIITVRTEVLKDADGNVIKQSAYEGKKITVKGIIDYYNGSYQVKCWRADYITVV